MAAPAASAQPIAVEVDDGVADLAGESVHTAADGAVGHDAAADAGADPDADEVTLAASGPQRELALHGDADVVPDAHVDAESVPQHRRQRDGVASGERADVRRTPHDARHRVDRTGAPDADAGHAGQSTEVVDDTGEDVDDIVRRAGGRCLAFGLGDDRRAVGAGVEADAVDLRPPEVEADAQRLCLGFLGDAEIPVEDQVLALGVADDALAVAPELRVVRREQQQPGEDPLAELLDDVALAELRLHVPVGRDRAEVHDTHVAAWRLRFGFLGGDV
jgi:hypothetical protein